MLDLHNRCYVATSTDCCNIYSKPKESTMTKGK